MAKLNVDFFIARRMGSSPVGDDTSSAGSGSRGVVVRIAIATVGVSMAVMIVAVSVIAGFRSQLSGNVTAFTGSVHIQALDYGGTVETQPIALDRDLESDIASLPGFRSIALYALKTGMLKSDEATLGVTLKGVDAHYDMSSFRGWLRQGNLPRRGDSVRHKDLLMSTSAARMLHLAVDDRVEMLFVGGPTAVRRDRFRVCGLYSSGMGELDEAFAFTDISNVRRLEGWGDDRATGYEITTTGMKGLPEFEVRVRSVVADHDESDPALMVRSVKEDFPQLFDWLATHDVNAAVIITIMIAVALVSMISALLVIVLERIRMIGILKTLGMTSRSLRRIFVLRAARIVLWGLLIGDVVGIGLSVVQRSTGAVKLDETGYFVSTVPIEMNWWWIAALNVGTLAVIVGLLLFPTTIVGRITPEKTIRYQ